MQEEAQLAQERKQAEIAAVQQAQERQQEIYLSMREVREQVSSASVGGITQTDRLCLVHQAKRAREEEEQRMDAMYAAQEKASREADAQQKAAAERARKQAQQQDAERATQCVPMAVPG